MTALELAAVLSAGAYFGFLLLESWRLQRARAQLAIVVQVNGTRGKTETTRLLAAALRAGGLRTLAKTTGTEPRLILEDGSERRWRRWGAANVREQRNFMFLAARRKAQAVVVECMAVSPDAQRASTAFLTPDLLIVTNSRPDHQEELGSPEQALAVFAEGIPAGGTVLTADPGIHGELGRVAAARGAQAILAAPCPEPGPWHPDNAGAALAAAAQFGVSPASALAGMRGHTPDPGAFALRRIPATAVTVVDALAANDTVSTDLLFRRGEAMVPAGAPKVLLIGNRDDRPDRALAYARWAAAAPERWTSVLWAGAPGPAAQRTLAAAFPGQGADGRPRLRRLRDVRELALEPAGTVIYATGNWRGLGPALAALAPALAALAPREEQP
jgi:poly-gamma-glutamate synthase PgsB/CapB